MRRFLSPLAVLCVAPAAILPAPVAAEPGWQWEISVEMEGMPFAMPKQKLCAPKASKEPPVTEDNGDCKFLEKKQSGNRFQWKAQCKGGTMVGDVTSTPTSYKGSMRMTEGSGESMSMKMSGKRVGECDTRERSGELKAMQKQQDEALRLHADEIARACGESLERMEGSLIVAGQCPNEKKTFCKRLATADGYDRASRSPDPASVARNAKACGLDQAKLRPRLCAGALSDANFEFVGRHCEADKPKLCGKAAASAELDYVSANCPNEKSALLKEHCEGRMYTSQIDARYRDFCAGAGSQLADDGSAGRRSGAAESVVPTDLQDGVRKLKGLLGF